MVSDVKFVPKLYQIQKLINISVVAIMESEIPQIYLNKMIISRYRRKLISRYKREINLAPNLQRLMKTIQTLNQMF